MKLRHLPHRDSAREILKKRSQQELSPESLRAQEDFPFFCEHLTRNSTDPKVQPEHMHLWNDHLITGENSKCLLGVAGPNTDILAPRNSAKAQPLDEPILTPAGWVLMGSLQIGDCVVAVDGTPTPITQITPQGRKKNYRVTFTDGSFTYCSDDHLWTIRSLGGTDPRAFKTVTLNHLRTKVFAGTKGNRGKTQAIYRNVEPGEIPWLDYRGYAKYHIPVSQPVQFPQQLEPVNPYLLGVLIGDGNLTNSSIGISTGDAELLDLLTPLIPSCSSIKPHGKHPCNYIITRNVFRGQPLRNPLITGLRSLGLWGKPAETKFIPQQYLYSSIESRIALLQGLMDTDGTVGNNTAGGGNLSFCSISRQLIDDVVELVQSLGGIATVNQPQKNWYTINGERRQGQTSYKVGIKLPPDIQPFRLTRKKNRYKPCAKRLPTRGIIDIEYVGETEMQCITIAHPSQLYLTRHCIVTHNSTYLGMFSAWLTGRHARPRIVKDGSEWVQIAGMWLPILYISYTVDVARPKSNTIKNIIESKEYQEIFPNVRPGRKWADELWSIDYGFAGINTIGQDTYSVCCAGLKGAIVSKRSAFVILDDIIKSAEDIENIEIREEMAHKWQEAIKPTMFEGARAVCLGTRFRGDDIHCTTFIPERDWIQIEQSALIEDPETGEEYSYWEKQYSTEALKDKRDGPDGDPVVFSFQYQNKVVRSSSLSIDPSWIVRDEVPHDIRVYDALALGIDLSSKLKEKNDFTTMFLGGRIGNRFYILDMRRGKWMGNIDKMNVLLEMAVDWGLIDRTDTGEWKFDQPFKKGQFKSNGIPLYIYGEDAQYQASLAGDFTTYMINELGLYDFIYRLSGTQGQDLLVHLRGVTGLFQNGLVTWNQYRAMGIAITELENFGAYSHDDCVSGVCHLLRGLRQLARLEAI